VAIRNFVTAEYANIDRAGKPMLVGIFSVLVAPAVPWLMRMAILAELEPALTAPASASLTFSGEVLEQSVNTGLFPLPVGQRESPTHGILLWSPPLTIRKPGELLVRLSISGQESYERRIPVGVVQAATQPTPATSGGSPTSS
jgi:hypothetical protein